MTLLTLLMNVSFFFCFFPFFKLIPGVSAEVQPLGSILAAVVLAIWGVRRDGVLYCSLLLICLLVLFAGVTPLRGAGTMPVIMQSAAYLLPIITLLVMREYAHLLSVRVFYWAFGIHMLIGVLQQFDLLQAVSPILEKIVWRFSPNAIGFDRGVALLTPEPSYGGTILALAMATNAYFYSMGKVSRQMFLGMTALIIGVLFINKSGTGFLLLTIFFAGYCFSHFMRLPLRTKLLMMGLGGVGLCAMLLTLDYLIAHYSTQMRFLWILGVLKDLLTNTVALSESAVSALAGKRFLTAWIGYRSLGHAWWGHGIAAHLLDFWELSYYAGVLWINNQQLAESERYMDSLKPDAYGAGIAMDMGILGLLLLIALVVSAVRLPGRSPVKKENSDWKLRQAILGVALFSIFFNCTTALPSPWVMLAFVATMGRSNSAVAQRSPT